MRAGTEKAGCHVDGRFVHCNESHFPADSSQAAAITGLHPIHTIAAAGGLKDASASEWVTSAARVLSTTLLQDRHAAAGEHTRSTNITIPFPHALLPCCLIHALLSVQLTRLTPLLHFALGSPRTE